MLFRTTYIPRHPPPMAPILGVVLPTCIQLIKWGNVAGSSLYSSAGKIGSSGPDISAESTGVANDSACCRIFWKFCACCTTGVCFVHTIVGGCSKFPARTIALRFAGLPIPPTILVGVWPTVVLSTVERKTGYIWWIGCRIVIVVMNVIIRTVVVIIILRVFRPWTEAGRHLLYGPLSWRRNDCAVLDCLEKSMMG